MIKHETTSIMIYNEASAVPRKVLLLHHRKLHVWMPPGGHVESGENQYEAAVREAREETGLDISVLLAAPIRLDELATLLPRPDFLLEEKIAAHDNEPEHCHLDSVYVVRMPEQEVEHAETEAHDISWFTQEQLADLAMFDNVRQMVVEELQA